MIVSSVGVNSIKEDLYNIKDACLLLPEEIRKQAEMLVNNYLMETFALQNVDIEKHAKKGKEPSDHLYSRPMVFRKNYDYGEGWQKMLDEFRAGKIKGVRDFVKKKRKEKSPIKDLYNKANFVFNNEIDEFLTYIGRFGA